jgi:hypothetical protein
MNGFTRATSSELLFKMNALTSSSVIPPGGATLESALTEMERSRSRFSNTKIVTRRLLIWEFCRRDWSEIIKSIECYNRYNLIM